jgi:hypothetical protein
MRLSYRCVCAFAALAIAVLAVSAKDPGEVKDDAKFFKADTVKKVNEAIRDLDKKGIRLAVETLPVPKDAAEKLRAFSAWLDLLKETGVQSPPKETTDKLKGLDKKAREEYFHRWAAKRAKELGPATILILVTNEPKHLEVGITPEIEKKGFTNKDKAALASAMIERLNKGQIDDALLDAVMTVRKHFDAPAKD